MPRCLSQNKTKQNKTEQNALKQNYEVVSQSLLACKSQSCSRECRERNDNATTACCMHLFPTSLLKCSPAKTIHQPCLPREPGCAHGCVQGLANCNHNRVRGVGETVGPDTMSQQYTCQSWNTATAPAMLTGSADSLWVNWEEEATAKCCFISNAKEVSEVPLLSFSLVATT